MNKVVINVKNLGKKFMLDRPLHKQIFTPFVSGKRISALNNICFDIKNGEILGVVGPNGAGKTTLLRILANLLDSDSGSVELFDKKLNGDCNMRTNIGYVSNDERSFFWRLTGKQNLEFFAKLYGIRKSQAHERINLLLNWFDLNKKAEEPFRNYSNGTKKKFSILRAMIHRPKVLLLDEITNSLDPISTESIKQIVRDYITNQKDSCALWSTHRFDEICEICDKILILHNGQNSFFGKPGELLNKYKTDVAPIDNNNNNEHLISCLKTVISQNN